MGNLIFKPADEGHLQLQNDAGTTAIEIQDDDSSVHIAGDLSPTTGPANFVGMIASFGKASGTINGWIICDGSAVSRSTYSVLFGVIGTTWGAGDGSSTFNIPDLEGVFLRGTGAHGTNNMANGNDFAGPNVGVFENDTFHDHLHRMRNRGGGSGSADGIEITAQDNSGVSEIDQNISGTGNGYSEHNSNGAPRSGDETRPFNVGVKYYIKY